MLSLQSLFRRTAKPAPKAADPGLHEVLVHAVSPVSDRAVLLELRPVSGTHALSPYAAGAHVDLHLGQRLVRQYSLISMGAHEESYFVCVQREDAGRGGSLAVHQRVRVGDTLRVSAPRNTFALRNDREPALLLAGGVGITPLVSMAEQLHSTGTRFELHAYARNAQILPLHAHLGARPYRENVEQHFSDSGDSFRTSSPDTLTSPGSMRAIYVCGPQSFIDLAKNRAAEAGWDPTDIMSEQFTASTGSGDTTARAPFTVIAASTGQAMEVGPDDSIADVLERNGYQTYRSCGEGYCGSCLTRVVAGIPEHRDVIQSDAEHAANTQINVCCSRSRTPILELEV